MTLITDSDYIQILEYYNQNIPNSKRLLKKQAEGIMASKLCKCIKKIGNNESRAIGICTKTIFNRKGFTRGIFKCKGKKSVYFSKTSKTSKTKRNK